MNPRRLFVASCISLITSAFTFVVRGDILQPMGNAFSLSQTDKGSLEGAVFLGMAFSMFVGGFICDLLGMKRIMFLAFYSHLIGVLGTIFAPQLVGAVHLGSTLTFWWLFGTSFLMGCGNGMVETGINPLAATLFPTKKTHYLNILHAWWPGGLIIGGIAVKFVRQGIDLGFLYIPGLDLKWEPNFVSWQVSLFLIVIPCLIYGAMLIGQRFPLTERVESGVSTGDMFKEAIRPAFLLWAFCMLLTAATELGPQKWQESVMSKTAGLSGTMILVYTSGLMFVMRHFAGPLAHALSPVGMLTLSATLSAIGLFLLSYATNGLTAFAYATIFGVGIAYFWPTMLGVTAEKFPRGGALLLCLMGSAGNISISQVLPAMGKIYDNYSVTKLQQENPDLAERVVKGDALDQNVIKRIDLRVQLTADEQRAIDPRNWLTAEQQQKLTPPKSSAGSPPELTSADLNQLNLTLEQQLILRELLNENGDSVKEQRAIDQALAESPTLAPQQKQILAQLRTARGQVGDLALFREVAAAQLTPEQKTELASILERNGQASARQKVLDGVLNPDDLTSHQNKVINQALDEMKDQLTPAQNAVQQKRDQILTAEAFGASMAFRWVSVLPAFLILIFGVIALSDRMRGGYKAVHISEVTEEKEATPL
jgi:fucose permease